jgi:hypothetical protein
MMAFSRNLPSSLFLLPVLSELGYPILSHGVLSVGPKVWMYSSLNSKGAWI